MKDILQVRDKKVIYLNDIPLTPDAFDYVYEFKNHIIAYNSDKLVIVSPEGNILVSEEGKVLQVCDGGKYVSLQKNNVVGAYQYDGSLFIPFEFYCVFIFDGPIYVIRNYGDSWELY